MSHIAVFLFIAAILAGVDADPLAWVLFAGGVVVELLRIGGVGLKSDDTNADIEPPLPD